MRRPNLLLPAALALACLLPATALGAPPGNDNFGAAKVLTGTSLSVDFNVAEATKQAGEANHKGYSAGKSVWFAWTPTKLGGAHASTCGGTGQPDVVEVYTGAWGSLTPVSDVSTSGCSTLAEQKWMAIPMTTYWIAVDVLDSWEKPGAGTLALVQDTEFPVTSFAGWPAVTTGRTTAQFQTAGGGFLTDWECKLDGKPLPSCEPGMELPWVFDPSLKSGTHSFSVRAEDYAGNRETSWKTKTWTVDVDGPKTTRLSPQSQDVTATPALAFAGTEAGQTFECRYAWSSDPAWSACTSPVQPPERPLWAHNVLQVRGVDALGNRSTDWALMSWRLVPGPKPVVTPTPVPTPVPTPEPQGDTTPCVPTVTTAAKVGRRALRRRGLAVRVTAPEHCSVFVSLQTRHGAFVAGRQLAAAPGAAATARLRAKRKVPGGRVWLVLSTSDAAGNHWSGGRRAVRLT